MQLKQIKVGKWYETKRGIGECTRSGGTFPPSVQLRITYPLPRGLMNFRPRDVLCETNDPNDTRDTTDRDPRWCTVRLTNIPYDPSTVLIEQCEHVNAQGRYVVEIHGEWHGFDPNTKLQALAWINGKPEREQQIKWLCFECVSIMPLGK